MERTQTLTDRYVHEVVRRIPGGQREDVARELQGTIADTIEARAGSAGSDASQRAEWDVIAEMGDPALLAASYADRPQWLIGPAFLPAYWSILRILLLVVLPIVVALTVVLDIVDGAGIGPVIGSAVEVILSVGGQMVAWLTLVFALVERFGGREAAEATAGVSGGWTPDALPSAKEVEREHGGDYASVVWSVLVIGLLLWQRTAPPYAAGVDRIEVVNPDLWSGWIWPVIIGLAAVAVLELVAVARRGWSMGRAGLYAVVELGASGTLAWLLHSQEFLNPAFVADINQDWTTPDEAYTGLALIILGFALWDVVKRLRAALR